MDHITVSQLTDYCRIGVVNSAYLVPFPMRGGYSIWVQLNGGDEFSLMTARGEQRFFKSADTALDTLRVAGFRRPVTVHTE